MLKAVFSRQKQSQSQGFKEYYSEWFTALKNNLLPLLRRSISGDSPTILSTHVEMLHQHFQSYYHALDAAITSDPTQLLSQPWRHPLEIPLLWLGDLHPSIFTNLARSFLHQQQDQEDDDDDDQDQHHHHHHDDDNHSLADQIDRVSSSSSSLNLHRPWQVALAWRNPPESLLLRMDEIECGLRVIVPTLSDRLARAEAGFVHRVVGDWFQCRESKGAAKVAVGEDVRAHMDEVVSVFLCANRVRRSVLVDIISAATVYQAALFLEGLAQFLIGFKDHDLLTSAQH
ncbi:protein INAPERTURATE POLLEN1 [Lotus japonicus]|uniref:protein INAPERTURATE POLLEN1 n=1 Tax=Lotus japonicus TaxID=34305 RepID=UPI00258E6039|nr:protein INAPERTURATE POLLEN1 [Lotus japonicus]